MTMQALPAGMRPREKLLAHGAHSLSDAELLALLLRTGRRGHTVLQLADELLALSGGLYELLHRPEVALRGVKGLGPAKRAELGAVMELARRCLQHRLRAAPVFDSPAMVKDYLRLQLGHRPHEVFAALYLDAQHRLIRLEELFRGTLTQTSVYPREVVKQALALNAAAVVLSHNHPSGMCEPSRADEVLTRTLQSALQLVDVRVLDHVVVSACDAISFAERGLL